MQRLRDELTKWLTIGIKTLNSNNKNSQQKPFSSIWNLLWAYSSEETRLIPYSYFSPHYNKRAETIGRVYCHIGLVIDQGLLRDVSFSLQMASVSPTIVSNFRT